MNVVLDAGSFDSWDEAIDLRAHASRYREDLKTASMKAGCDESVVTGYGRVRGRPVAVIASEFKFLGGSVGRDAARRITSAVRRATAEGLPLLATTCSGGTRMQEGTPAFVEMIGITRALMAHRRAGLAYLVHLRNPTMGGVLASWGSLGHITVAEPGALIGLIGPVVYQALRGEAFPAGVQTAENLVAKGVIDAVVPIEDLAGLIDRTLAVISDPSGEPALPRRILSLRPGRSAWNSILATRAEHRVGVRDLLRHGAGGTIRLYGTNQGERDDSLLLALTRLDGMPCVLIGQDRSRQSVEAPLGAAALRSARRAMCLAEELQLPLVAIIDTPGAEMSQRAEERGLSGEIARCIATLSTLTVPSVSVLLGQGCGGAAVALLASRAVIATENAWLAPLSPEGASAILHSTVRHAGTVAEAQRVRAVDLLEAHVVHHVVPELEDDQPTALAIAVVAEIRARLDEQLRTGIPMRAARGARVTERMRSTQSSHW